VNTPAFREFYRTEEFTEEQIMQIMGLKAFTQSDFTKKIVKGRLKNQLVKLESKNDSKRCSLLKNIKKLGKTLHLNSCEKDILAFACCTTTEQVLQEILENIGEIGKPVLRQILLKILGHSPKMIQKALSKDSTLISSGLISIISYKASVHDKMAVMDGLIDILYQESIEPSDILSNFFAESQAPELKINQFPHLMKDTKILVPFLRNAIKQKTEGINILIYGVPGTGKTQFARCLADSMELPMYEVNNEDSDGDPLSGQARFSAYRLCQKVLSPASGVILFDEIEDVFPDSSFSFLMKEDGINKGWTNRVLESNPNPAIWISNSIQQIDPAYKRRFDYVMEIHIPPRSVRKEIIKLNFDRLKVGEKWVEQLSENEHITPALLNKSAKVAKLTGEEGGLKNEQVLEHTINNNFNLMGISEKLDIGAKETIQYSLEYLNTPVDLQNLISGLQKSLRARICLYGHSGTGKTEFAQYLARQVDKPIIQKRASDLLDKYIGETEKRIAGMFQQAREDNSILFIDEADSFLRDRESLRYQWEVTQVNELLVNMEGFEGIFICSTNLKENLDKASLRRFDFKIAFDYLTQEQRWKLFEQVTGELGIKIHQKDYSDIKRQLRLMDNLTPGDFALVKRQYLVCGINKGSWQFLDALKQETLEKPDCGRKVIGFGQQNLQLQRN